jgi:hypothetical protein
MTVHRRTGFLPPSARVHVEPASGRRHIHFLRCISTTIRDRACIHILLDSFLDNLPPVFFPSVAIDATGMSGAGAALTAVGRSLAMDPTQALRVLAALATWRLLRYAQKPTKDTMQTIVTFWSSVIPSEFPFHILAVHLYLIAKGSYGRPGQGLMHNAGIATALGALIPIVRMVAGQINSRGAYVQGLKDAGVPIRLASRPLSLTKSVMCALPFPHLLMRNLKCIPGIVYASAPARVSVAQALKDAAAHYGVAGHAGTSAAGGDALLAAGSVDGGGGVARTEVKMRDLKLDIYYHTKRRRANAPVLVYVHGGGWVV